MKVAARSEWRPGGIIRRETSKLPGPCFDFFSPPDFTQTDNFFVAANITLTGGTSIAHTRFYGRFISDVPYADEAENNELCVWGLGDLLCVA